MTEAVHYATNKSFDDPGAEPDPPPPGVDTTDTVKFATFY